MCGRVCLYTNEHTEATIMMLLRSLSLPPAACDSNESIMNRFVEEAMNGRRDDVVLPFPFSISITQEMKPNNLIKRLCLRGNLQGQWKYLVDKTSTALTDCLPFSCRFDKLVVYYVRHLRPLETRDYYQVPYQFSELDDMRRLRLFKSLKEHQESKH
jgi:hypothetical protein